MVSPSVQYQSCLGCLAQWINSLMNTYLVELPAFEIVYFHKVAIASQYHKHSYRGGGGIHSQEVAEVPIQKFSYISAIWHQFRLFSAPHITKWLDMCGDSLLAVCLSRKNGAIHIPLWHPQASDRLKKEASVKVDC